MRTVRLMLAMAIALSIATAAMAQEKKAAGKTKNAKTKKDLFSNPLPSGGRRGDDPGSKKRLVDLLRWIL